MWVNVIFIVFLNTKCLVDTLPFKDGHINTEEKWRSMENFRLHAFSPRFKSGPQDIPPAPVLKLPKSVRISASQLHKELFTPEVGIRPVSELVKSILLPGNPPPKPPPSTAERKVQVLCFLDRMYVRILRSVFSSPKASEHLKMGSCPVNKVTTTHYYFTSPLTGCDVRRREDDNRVIYSNTLCYKPPVNGPVVWELPFSVPVHCRYTKFHRSYQVGFLPKIGSKTLYRGLQTRGGVTLTAMDASWNVIPASQSFLIGQPICFEAQGPKSGKNERLYLNRCIVTSSEKPVDKYVVVANYGCLVNSKNNSLTKFYTTADKTTVRLCFPAFIFTDAMPPYFNESCNQSEDDQSDRDQSSQGRKPHGQSGQSDWSSSDRDQSGQGRKPYDQSGQGRKPHGQSDDDQSDRDQSSQGREPHDQSDDDQSDDDQSSQGQDLDQLDHDQSSQGRKPHSQSDRNHQGRKPHDQSDDGQSDRDQSSQGRKPHDQSDDGQSSQGRKPHGQSDQGRKPHGQSDQGRKPHGQSDRDQSDRDDDQSSQGAKTASHTASQASQASQTTTSQTATSPAKAASHTASQASQMTASQTATSPAKAASHTASQASQMTTNQTATSPAKASMFLHCEFDLGPETPTAGAKSCMFNTQTNKWTELYDDPSVCDCCESTCHSPHRNSANNRYKSMTTSKSWEVKFWKEAFATHSSPHSLPEFSLAVENDDELFWDLDDY
ncbi:uncharacterized protein LOC127652096 [Xyrauchen texanus]|uniref:uncharacterized protein LOC127652096 n=1 Tax=Xyrauchen texanus TaxID=154827 RepID=UPI00224235D3|nr:uncharacterized protein LOC127652096 [Xyrauchen texanus]